MKIEPKNYVTAEEHRAYVDGVYAVARAVIDSASDLWGLGRESYDLDRLRDEMLDLICASARNVNEAQRIEKK